MIIKFNENAAAYGLGYREGAMLEVKDSHEFETQVLTTVVDEKGVPRSYKYTAQKYKVEDLVEAGVCQLAKKDEAKLLTDAKAKFLSNKDNKESDFSFNL